MMNDETLFRAEKVTSLFSGGSGGGGDKGRQRHRFRTEDMFQAVGETMGELLSVEQASRFAVSMQERMQILSTESGQSPKSTEKLKRLIEASINRGFFRTHRDG